ncbi:MAG: hypothetical protein EZS28_045872 [Streblomastix strix]|uniref:B30.2/SPRY domain-containing protein n=1 Tax=Streblomastix strix TaxID=222440 RepID=A0A5J4TM53_9EUKA|nr:MAG: hypothetical protein EZS28_045872 [Streblomastix strix]
MKKISKTQQKNNCISLSQVLENGVYSVEAVFENTDNNWNGVGIVQDSYNIPDDSRPDQSPGQAHMAVYGVQIFSGNTWCKGNRTDGNAKFQNNQIIKMEYDSEKGTLIFFLDNIQQPVYITGIKEKVRFMIYLYNSGSSCTIRSLKKLAAPTSVYMPNEKAVLW